VAGGGYSGIGAMRAPDCRIWSRIPGYESDDSDTEADSKEDVKLRLSAEERFNQVVAVLGQRWLPRTPIKFVPAARPVKTNVLVGRGGGPLRPGAPVHGPGPPPCFNINHMDAILVKETFLASGLVPDLRDWIVQWSGPNIRDTLYQSLHEFQHVNHFPGSSELTRKDRLWAHFSEMAHMFGTRDFDFVPETYVLPHQVEQFLECYERTNHIWIVKPNASSRGRGIFLLRDLGELPLDEQSVVCRYVQNPLLIQGLKFDLRVYVLVTSFEPLRAYVYREGLTRFASKPYSTSDEHLQTRTGI
jgi:tubulin polyglutamylase TTLL5